MQVHIQHQDIHWNNIDGSPGCYVRDVVTANIWGGASLHHVRVEAGEEIAVHTHETQTEAHFIISGNGVALVDGREYAVHSGDVVMALPEVSHGIINTDTGPLILLCVFNPPLKQVY